MLFTDDVVEVFNDELFSDDEEDDNDDDVEVRQFGTCGGGGKFLLSECDGAGELLRSRSSAGENNVRRRWRCCDCGEGVNGDDEKRCSPAFMPRARRLSLEAYGTGDCLKNSDGDHGTIAPGCMPSDCMAAIDCKPSVI